MTARLSDQPSPSAPPFAGFLTTIHEHAGPLTRTLIAENAFHSEVLKILMPALIYLLNERRIEKTLPGLTPEDRYQAFNADLVPDVLTEIETRFAPVHRRLHERLTSFEDLCHTITDRYEADADELRSSGIIPATDDAVEVIEPTGDLHAGTATSRVGLTSGVVVYFKPRTAANETLLQRVSDLVCRRAGDEPFPVTPPVLDHTTYCWVQAVERTAAESSEDIRTYYRRSGHLLLVAYALRLTDLHHENIVPVGDRPCVVDAETIFTTMIRQPSFPTSAATEVNGKILASVTGTGMLPIVSGMRIYGGDVSAFSRGHWRPEKRVLINPERDDLRYERGYEDRYDPSHLAFLADTDGHTEPMLPNDHVDTIIEGFTRSYQALLESREDIRQLLESSSEAVRCRLLARRTSDYSVFIEYLWSISNLSRQEDLTRRLRRSGAGIPTGVMESEERQIAQANIPSFACGAASTSITDADGIAVGQLSESPLRLTLEHLDSLDEQDLTLQRRLIEFTFESEEVLSLVSPTRVTYQRHVASSEISDAAHQLWEQIVSTAAPSRTDDSVNWLSLGVDDHDQFELRPLIGSVYEGTTGLALGMLDYRDLTGQHSGDGIFQAIGREATEAFHRDLESPKRLLSYYNGAAGHLALLSALSQRGLITTDVDQLTETFLSTCLTASLDDVDTDVLAGVSGTLIALADAPDGSLRAHVAERLATYLVSLRETRWTIDRPRGLDNASFAHGASGIATGLLHAAHITGDSTFRDEWRAAWKHEAKFRAHGSWRDERHDDGDPSANWCHGLTGIMLARHRWLCLDDTHGLLSRDERTEVTSELHDAARGVQNIGLDLNSLSLCHGILGNLLALESVSNKLPTSSWDDDWHSVAGFGLRDGWLCGLSSFVESYSAMTGVSGMLHAFSRAAAGTTSPSALLMPSLTGGRAN
ncbi:type 2 lanthipeptide synthetase LanM family protein [Auritidibacter ignavus]|uniref:type 2 lanthipeptide synthetase LanM family protein n=1 Tax=Auritidibacter ignavus TaxID=678932 RepID=UPI00244D0177|nr:type 2 lanthipeptide synthetase LanM family protein [Auritidibacter ignavus]WGH82978.1 type 2 lanthipeptide synthetase LanM family protein [Auritidibacter ignavus]WHS34068.1 type 2 lanthipeptide synthetase LanM family protein [Auritidibacter ignavus]